MGSEKNVLKVRIYGAEYSVASQEDISRIKKVAEYVDQKMHRVDQTVRVDSSLKVAILACVNITYELFKEREENDRLRKMLEERVHKLNARIDEQL